MQQIDEVIELLEKTNIRERADDIWAFQKEGNLNYDQRKAIKRYSCLLHDVAKIIEDALAKLRETPKPTEFTKRARRRIATDRQLISRVEDTNETIAYLVIADEALIRLGEACDIIEQLQKQSDLLTLGLLQEKDEVRKLKEALRLVLNENFSGQSTLSPYAKRQANEVMSEPKLCICCEEITEENAHLHRNCGK